MAVVTEVSETKAREIRDELPEIGLLHSDDVQKKVVAVWSTFLADSTYARIGDCPALPGLQGYDLARHTRHVVQNCVDQADTLKEFWDIDCDREALLTAALVHDASKLVEYTGVDGAHTEIGKALLHAQLAGVRCLDVGLSAKVANIVTYHPYTPPHVHVRPQYVEFVILTWADLAAVDPIFFLAKKATHLEIARRFFEIE
jgi:HD domain-containing protein